MELISYKLGGGGGLISGSLRYLKPASKGFWERGTEEKRFAEHVLE